MSYRLAWPLVLAGCLAQAGAGTAADPAPLRLTAPVPHQVVQRSGYGPAGARAGGRGRRRAGGRPRARGLLPRGRARGLGVPGGPARRREGSQGGWAKLDSAAGRGGGPGPGRRLVSAGGPRPGRGRGHPSGGGRAGRSRRGVPGGRPVVRHQLQRRAAPGGGPRTRGWRPWTRPPARWRVADDPQPVADSSDGGSIWPPVGDALVKEFGVPVGFANVAVGGHVLGPVAAGRQAPRAARGRRRRPWGRSGPSSGSRASPT